MEHMTIQGLLVALGLELMIIGVDKDSEVVRTIGSTLVSVGFFVNVLSYFIHLAG